MNLIMNDMSPIMIFLLQDPLPILLKEMLLFCWYLPILLYILLAKFISAYLIKTHQGYVVPHYIMYKCFRLAYIANNVITGQGLYSSIDLLQYWSVACSLKIYMHLV